MHPRMHIPAFRQRAAQEAEAAKEAEKPKRARKPRSAPAQALVDQLKDQDQ